MINLSDQFVGGRFAVGKVRYKLLNELWVYGAKDSQKGREISLLVLFAENEREKLDSFLDYLSKHEVRKVESAYFSHLGQTYFYAAVDLADKRHLEEIFQNWVSGKPAPVLQPKPVLPPAPLGKLEKAPVFPIDIKKQNERSEKLKFFSIGVVSILVVLVLIAFFALPKIVAVFSPTATPTLQIVILKDITPAQNFLTGESLAIPANSQIVIINSEQTPCEILADWNGTQVLIDTRLIFPERDSSCN